MKSKLSFLFKKLILEDSVYFKNKQKELVKIVNLTGLYSNGANILKKLGIYNRNFIKKNLILKGNSKKFDEEIFELKNKCLILKGLALYDLNKKYGRIRSFKDLDLLILKKDFNYVSNYLINKGYKSNQLHNIKNKETYHQQFFKKYLIEVHWALEYPTSPFLFNLDSIFSRKIKNKKYSTLSYEDYIIYLSIHIAYHNFFRNSVKYLQDLFLLLKYEKLNWDMIYENSKKSNTLAFTYYFLYMFKKEFNLNIPKKLLDNLKKYSNKKHLFFLNRYALKDIIKLNNKKDFLHRPIFEIYFSNSLKKSLLISSRMIKWAKARKF